jgi:hypothetical protein
LVDRQRVQPGDDALLPDLFRRFEALAQGWTRHQVEWALRSGRWGALRRGVYTVASRYDAMEPISKHLLDCRAAMLVHDDRHAVSHVSAALSYGLPCPIDGAGRPTLTIGTTGASTDRQDDLVVQVASLRERDVTQWMEGRRTTPARTVADCLRHVPLPDAVAIADAAIRAGLTDETRIDEVLRWQDGWPYLRKGLAGRRLIDPRRESWLESFSFVVLHQHGLPLPVPQVTINDQAGRFIGRVDGFWPDRATVCEADGRTKYRMGRPAAGATAPSDVLVRRAIFEEKDREDRLRDVGLEVVRWSTREIVHFAPLVADRVRRAHRRGDPSRFVGRALGLAGALAVGTASGGS